jgi:hypothetical protein
MDCTRLAFSEQNMIGISLFVLRENGDENLTKNGWAAFHFELVRRVVKGDHAGQTGGREACRRRDDVGISEFDGQAAMTHWKGEYWLYAHSSPKEAGCRSVQVCHGESLDTLGASQMCTFEGLADSYDAYFLHPHILPNGRGLVSLISPVPADSDTKFVETSAGVYRAVTNDGVNWLQPYAVHLCPEYLRRAYDVPIAGSLRYRD